MLNLLKKRILIYNFIDFSIKRYEKIMPDNKIQINNIACCQIAGPIRKDKNSETKKVERKTFPHAQ